MKEKKESEGGDDSTISRFINSTGEISKALYLAKHPKEKKEEALPEPPARK